MAASQQITSSRETGKTRVGNPCRAKAFSLIEMLVATAVSAVLMAAVLVVVAGVSRDRKRITMMEAKPQTAGIVSRLQWDLTNAERFASSSDGRSLILIGHGSIDRGTLTPNGRLAKVTYRIYDTGEKTTSLVREQQYLDEPAAPKPWRDLVATDARSIQISPVSFIAPEDAEVSERFGATLPVPQRVRLRIEVAGTLVNQELWVH
jgi:prepilin-type N-terminal cleavage/methylation domain-containing protein